MAEGGADLMKIRQETTPPRTGCDDCNVLVSFRACVLDRRTGKLVRVYLCPNCSKVIWYDDRSPPDLIHAAHHDLERIVLRRSVQRLRFLRGRHAAWFIDTVGYLSVRCLDAGARARREIENLRRSIPRPACDDHGRAGPLTIVLSRRPGR